MDATAFATLAEVLKASGPYGLVVVLGWAFWRINERKDREIKALGEKVIAMAEAQTLAISKVETALVALRRAIDEFANGSRGKAA